MKTPDGRCRPNIFGPGPWLSDGTPLKTLSGTGTRRKFRTPDGEVFEAPATCNAARLGIAAAAQGALPLEVAWYALPPRSAARKDRRRP